jgi:hypothetical protein
MDKSVILFHSTNYALWAAEELKKNDIACKMISVPRRFSTDCGYCVQINFSDRLDAENILQYNKIDFDRIEDL